jgi:trimeric autotransporter adhesin
MAITLFSGAPGIPSDNGTNVNDPSAFNNPPIASMVAGDLCVIVAAKRNSTGSISMSDTGGQSWTQYQTVQGTAVLTSAVFWCRYNGTWSSAPSVSFGATTNNTIWMLIFRPTTGTNVWTEDSGPSADKGSTFAAASPVSITGWTPANASNVNIAVWITDDDNTWGTLSGTNWVKTSLDAQRRNTSGSDTSVTIAYQIQTVAAPTNNVSQAQATLGNDPGHYYRISMYEAAPPATSLKDMIGGGIIPYLR